MQLVVVGSAGIALGGVMSPAGRAAAGGTVALGATVAGGSVSAASRGTGMAVVTSFISGAAGMGGEGRRFR